MHALPVQFHLKTIMWQNLKVPPLFILLNLGTTFMLVRIVLLLTDETPNFIHFREKPNLHDEVLTTLGFYLLPISAVVTIAFYLAASYINPGFIIGNEEVQLAKAQDYDLRH